FAAAIGFALYAAFRAVDTDIIIWIASAAIIAAATVWRTPTPDLAPLGLVGRASKSLGRMPLLTVAIAFGLGAAAIIVWLDPVESYMPTAIPAWLTTTVLVAAAHIGLGLLTRRLGGEVSATTFVISGVLRGVAATVVRAVVVTVISRLAVAEITGNPEVGFAVLAVVAIIAAVAIAPSVIRRAASRLIRAQRKEEPPGCRPTVLKGTSYD